MENATKALLMAGGILIAILILGALMLFATNLAEYKNSQDASEKSSQIAEFNNQYMPYDKDDLTLMELKTLYNKIESNNVKNPEEQIESNITSVYPNIARDFSTLPEEDKQNKVFECINIEYRNDNGKIRRMEFRDVT